MKKMKLFLEELRAPFFTASIIPIMLGAAIAYSESGRVDWLMFFMALAGGVLLHAGANVANDYFDFKNGNDEVNKEYIRPFTGGSRMIQKNLLSPKEVLAEFLICFALGSIIGLYLIHEKGLFILLLGLIGIFCGFFYTAPPLFLAGRGIGEIIIGLNFGVLMCLGSYYVQAHTIKLTTIMTAVPVSLLITAVLYVNEFPDFKADRSTGKNHLVVRLGRKKAVNVYIAIIVLTYTAILTGILVGFIPVWSLLTLVTLPFAIKSIIVLKKNYDNPQKLFPANALTVGLHLFVGLLMIVSFILKN